MARSDRCVKWVEDSAHANLTMKELTVTDARMDTTASQNANLVVVIVLELPTSIVTYRVDSVSAILTMVAETVLTVHRVTMATPLVSYVTVTLAAVRTRFVRRVLETASVRTTTEA